MTNHAISRLAEEQSRTGRELLAMRLNERISRRRLALFANRSEERIAQIERKLYVRADAVRRYRVALDMAVQYRSPIRERELPKRKLKKTAR